MDTPVAIKRWHEIMTDKDVSQLADLLHDDVIFHSPVVHTPQRGKQITLMYLTAAAHTLGNDSFKYVREVYGEEFAVLEFETVMDGIHINGIDMIQYNQDGQITDFKVMVRPLKAVNMIHQKMGEMLSMMKG